MLHGQCIIILHVTNMPFAINESSRDGNLEKFFVKLIASIIFLAIGMLCIQDFNYKLYVGAYFIARACYSFV